MRAVILAGGQGTRLRPYTAVLPKPLVPVGDRPILELIIRQLADEGFKEIDLCVGHLGGLIRAYFEEGVAKPEGLELRYHWEREPLGTAGALRLVDPPDGPVLVMNGDILTTLRFGDLMRFHAGSGAALSIATHKKRVTLALGVIEGEGEIVNGFVEKPTFDYRVSMGIYVYSPEAVDCIPDGRFDFPDVVLELIRVGKPVRSYEFDGAWYDIGTVEEHERAVDAYEEDPGLFERAHAG
jgi:NDP-mannose synthase